MLFTLCSIVAMQPASAQDPASECFPATGGDYPPSGVVVAIEVNLDLEGGALSPTVSITADGRLELTGAEPGVTYCGILFSDPITLAPTVAGPDGTLVFNTDVPADFELNAAHHLDVYREGRLVGAFDFCVTKSGNITSLTDKVCQTDGTTGKGRLARTGVDRLFDTLKIAALLLVAGAAFLYLRRRRHNATA